MKPLVLVVDDTDVVRRFMVRVLSDDFEVMEARDGVQALYWLGKWLFESADLPALIVSDLDMNPGMSGEELVAKLAADARTARIPVLLCSSEADLPSIAARLRVPYFLKQGSLVGLKHQVFDLVSQHAVAAQP